MRNSRGTLFLLVIPACVTIFVTPGTSFEPVNLIKFSTLMFMSFAVFGLAWPLLRVLVEKRNRAGLIPVVVFLLALITVFILTPAPNTQQLFGSWGRYLGFFNYLALVLLFLVAQVLSSATLIKKFLITVSTVAGIEVAYSLLQIAKADFFQWKNPNGWVLGTFGNPDFLSAFLGIACIASVPYFLTLKYIRQKFAIGVVECILLFVVVKSHAIQGLVIIALGIAIYLYFYLNSKVKKRWAKSYLVSTLVVAFIGVAGMLQIGPLQRLLYKESVTFRGDYWRAAIAMGKQHPICGVGLDSYGDHFRASRDAMAISRRGADLLSNSAHNLLLDLFACGGLVLLLSYLLLTGVVFIAGVKTMRRTPEVDWKFLAIFTAWICYQAQTIISINVASLSVWGWILAGLIVGYERVVRDGEVKRAGRSATHGKAAKFPAVPVAIAAVIGLMIAIPPFMRDAEFRSALVVDKTADIARAAMTWPEDSYRMSSAASALTKANHAAQGIEVARAAVKFNPRSFEAWQVISVNPLSPQSERDGALAKMKELDPLNSELK